MPHFITQATNLYCREKQITLDVSENIDVGPRDLEIVKSIEFKLTDAYGHHRFEFGLSKKAIENLDPLLIYIRHLESKVAILQRSSKPYHLIDQIRHKNE